MKIECRFCGAVNGPAVNNCVSCNMLLREYVPPEEKFGIDRLQEHMGAAKMPNPVKAFLLIAVAIAGFGFYRHFTAPVSDGSVATAPPVAANANTAFYTKGVTADEVGKKFVTPAPGLSAPMNPLDMKKIGDQAARDSLKKMNGGN